jgi:hypothetical protein
MTSVVKNAIARVRNLKLKKIIAIILVGIGSYAEHVKNYRVNTTVFMK